MRPGPELRGQGLMESSKLSPAENMPVTSVPRFMTESALQWWERWEVGVDQRPVVIQSAVRSSLGLEVPKPSSHITKKSNPDHQDLQPDTSRRCKGNGEKGTDQGWDRGGVGGSPGGGVLMHGQVFTFPTSTWGQAQQKGEHEQLF